MERVIEYYEAKVIEPIFPAKIFDAGAVEEAFRYMQNGSRIGKVVLSIRDGAGQLLLKPSASFKPVAPSFDPTAAYLLVGGLGGLGRAISSWMVEHGARHLVYLSRSAGQRVTDADFVRELHSQGCEAQLIKGKADAESMTIYAQAFSKDPQFYAFTKKMDAYRAAFTPETHLILSTGSDFLDLLQHAPTR